LQLVAQLLIELPFAGPIAFYQLLAQFDEITLEQWEYFEKATYRNRCHIAGADGLLRLTIPILHGRSHRQLVRDTRIAYGVDWRKQHWKSLEAAYRRSPYFEFYEDKLWSLYQSKPEFLVDFNLATHALIADCVGLNATHALSSQYEGEPKALDRRSYFLPGRHVETPVYHQVFQDRNGFIANLSVLDLLFNEGPAARAFLLQTA
jgi:hypothetical protein